MHRISMLGAGLIGMFYTQSLHANRSRDRVHVLYSRAEKRAKESAAAWGVEKWTADMDEAINHPETNVVVIGLPNALHKEAVLKAAKAGKAVLCTKPLATNAGVFHGYLEDLAYTPKMLKTIDSVSNGAIGKVLWTRSRETHPGPHSAWFWDKSSSGGGAIADMGCHCIEISRALVGKDIRPLEVVC
jgi:predicted dehydrogenase